MRDPALDATRSVSHFGIVAANMPFFALPGGYGLSWWLQGAGPADLAAVFLIRALFEGPFIGLFTLLFGFGVAQQLERHGRSYVWRRLGLLALVGLAHGWLLFGGDILLGFALSAALFLLLRPKRLLGLIVVGVSLSMLGLIGLSALQLLAAFPRPDANAILQIMQSGDLAQILLLGLQGWAGFYAAFPLHLMFFVLACFALGAWAQQRWGNMHGLADAITPWQRPLWLAGLLGCASYSAVMLLGQIQTLPALEYLAAPLRPLFGFVLTLPLFAALYRLMQRFAQARVTRLLARTGAASLSLYVGQSVLGVALFTGLGLYGALPMGAVLLVAWAMLIGLQLVLALWLQRFDHGPLEALIKPRRKRVAPV